MNNIWISSLQPILICKLNLLFVCRVQLRLHAKYTNSIHKFRRYAKKKILSILWYKCRWYTMWRCRKTTSRVSSCCGATACCRSTAQLVLVQENNIKFRPYPGVSKKQTKILNMFRKSESHVSKPRYLEFFFHFSKNFQFKKKFKMTHFPPTKSCRTPSHNSSEHL